MKPKKTNHSQGSLFEQRLSDQLNPMHEFYLLAEMIDWDVYENEFQNTILKAIVESQNPYV